MPARKVSGPRPRSPACNSVVAAVLRSSGLASREHRAFFSRYVKPLDSLRRLAQKYEYVVDVIGLVLLSSTLRLWGIGFDLPNLYHRDEAKYVTIPLKILKTGDYNPHFFNYPSLFFYVLSAVYVVYFLFMA